jgi:iron complex transport system permease protein
MMAMNKWPLILLIALSILSPLLALVIGVANISFTDVIQIICSQFSNGCEANALKERILLELRLPRVILAFLTGAGLALAGSVLQTVTRNPLADPYLFGISSGATFGAVLVIAVSGFGMGASQGLFLGWSQLGITGGAFIGSAVSVLLVISMAGRSVQIERMVLAGVATSFMFSAATSLVLYASDPQAASSLLFWSLGSFTRAGWENLTLPFVVLIICFILFSGFSRQLTALLSGDENARSLGVEVQKIRISMLLLTSLLTAILVANTGGIGFVGLMVPHIVRRLFENSGQQIMWITILFGGVFMVWVDVVSRTILPGHELPIGVITAAIGSVFFLLVMRRKSWS